LQGGINWWGHGAQVTWGQYVGDCKSLKIKNARHTHITNEKNMKGLVGGPVGGRPGGRPPPLNPALVP